MLKNTQEKHVIGECGCFKEWFHYMGEELVYSFMCCVDFELYVQVICLYHIVMGGGHALA
jgi:hypothetical protein